MNAEVKEICDKIISLINDKDELYDSFSYVSDSGNSGYDLLFLRSNKETINLDVFTEISNLLELTNNKISIGIKRYFTECGFDIDLILNEYYEIDRLEIRTPNRIIIYDQFVKP